MTIVKLFQIILQTVLACKQGKSIELDTKIDSRNGLMPRVLLKLSIFSQVKKCESALEYTRIKAKIIT